MKCALCTWWCLNWKFDEIQPTNKIMFCKHRLEFNSPGIHIILRDDIHTGLVQLHEEIVMWMSYLIKQLHTPIWWLNHSFLTDSFSPICTSTSYDIQIYWARLSKTTGATACTWVCHDAHHIIWMKCAILNFNTTYMYTRSTYLLKSNACDCCTK